MNRRAPGAWPAVVVTIVLTLSSAQVAATPDASDTGPRLVTTGLDPHVAKAVADEAAAAPAPASQRGPAASHGAFDAMNASPRRCSPLESTATLALVAACVRTQHCASSPTSPPSCYLFKGNVRR